MNREEGWGQKQPQEKSMGHVWKAGHRLGRRAEEANLNPVLSRDISDIKFPRLLYIVTLHVDDPCTSNISMLWPLLALLLLPFSLAAKNSAHEQLVELAAAGNGVIKLNEKVYDLLTSPKRDWSASVHFTALSPQRRCAPCKSVA